MEETQPLPQSELPLCDSLIIWVSTRGRGEPGDRAEVLGGGCLVTGTSQVSLRSSGDHLRRSGGHLRPGLRLLPSAPPVALDRESATYEIGRAHV